jgi:hypothetical protein
VGLLLLLLLAPAIARADTLYWLGAKLANGPGDPFEYYVDGTQSSPGGLPVANVQADYDLAYSRWADAGCDYITYKDDGLITDPARIGTHDDTKSVMATFIDSRTDSRYADELGNGVAVGVALTNRLNGVIVGCDTEYNHVDYTYSESGDPNSMDFPSLANHESGHCNGLDHDPDDFDSVMYPNVGVGELRRNLVHHDIDNICQLYPLTGALGSPCSGNSCGSGLSCINNPSVGGNFCSHGCDPQNTASCEAGFGCRASSEISGSTGACFPGQGDNANDVGAQCNSTNMPCSGSSATCIDAITNPAWIGGYCSQDCAGANSCPLGSVCVQFTGSNTSYCLLGCSNMQSSCRDGYACWPTDSAGNGFCYPACQTNADCNGAECLCNGVCASAGDAEAFIGSQCNTGFDCPTGAICIPPTLNGQSSGWPSGYCTSSCGGADACAGCPAGSSCVVDGAEGQSYCLKNCDANTPCRSGYGCSHQGNVDVCVPGCTSDAACEVGQHCVNGSCLRPDQLDGGQSCPLCPTDGGVQVSTTGNTGVPPPAPTPPRGCGCSSPGTGMEWGEVLFVWGLLVWSGRTRTRRAR